MSETWQTLKEWPELILERLEDAGVARIVLNRPDKRNCWNRALCHAFLEALDIIRADKELKVVITKGAGSVYSSGLDLNFLREVSNGPLLDWDRPNVTIQIAEALRAFPRIIIAQVHGYCLGRRTRHHELPRSRLRRRGRATRDAGSSARQLRAARSRRRCLHGGIPVEEARAHRRWSAAIFRASKRTRSASLAQAVPCGRPGSRTVTDIAREIASRHLATLEHRQDHGADGTATSSLSQAIQLDHAGRRAHADVPWTRSDDVEYVPASRRRAGRIWL